MPDHTTELTPYAPIEVGQVANQIAGKGLFMDFRSRLAANTRRRQDDDLQLFSDLCPCITTAFLPTKEHDDEDSFHSQLRWLRRAHWPWHPRW